MNHRFFVLILSLQLIIPSTTHPMLPHLLHNLKHLGSASVETIILLLEQLACATDDEPATPTPPRSPQQQPATEGHAFAHNNSTELTTAIQPDTATTPIPKALSTRTLPTLDAVLGETNHDFSTSPRNNLAAPNNTAVFNALAAHAQRVSPLTKSPPTTPRTFTTDPDFAEQDQSTDTSTNFGTSQTWFLVPKPADDH